MQDMGHDVNGKATAPCSILQMYHDRSLPGAAASLDVVGLVQYNTLEFGLEPAGQSQHTQQQALTTTTSKEAHHY